MKSNTHTPGKWKFKQTRGNNRYEHHIESDGYVIALLGMEYTGERTPEEIEANAARIVKCVNNHDRLLQAITDLLASYKLYVKKPDESEFVINAEAAIKEASE